MAFILKKHQREIVAWLKLKGCGVNVVGGSTKHPKLLVTSPDGSRSRQFSMSNTPKNPTAAVTSAKKQFDDWLLGNMG